MSAQVDFNSLKQDVLVKSGSEKNGYGISDHTMSNKTHVWSPVNGESKGKFSHSVSMSNGKDPKGSTLTIHDICYSVKVSDKGCCRSKEKQILKNMNASFKPGMNAILGPTGSGKSSLLDVLAGRKHPSGLTGTLLLDGRPTPQNFKCMVGYVVQDDVVMGTLTVRENFQFSAALRLPPSTTKAERDEKVENVIQELGLVHCADTKAGNEFIRGISGGERKRTNIGMELIISPPVLFLDEPTTGLDANTAGTVMILLKRLSMKGRTIIFSIHQPRYSIYRLFDHLMLLSLGETIYHGPAQESIDYFRSIGYPCQEYNNPPDFFLDVINGDPNATTNDINQILSSTDIEKTDTTEDEEVMHDKLVDCYMKSPWYQRAMSELTPIVQEHEKRVKDGTVERLPPVGYANNAFVQFLYCSQRTIRNLIRNPAVSVLQVLTLVIFGVVVGAIYWQIDDSCKSGLQNRTGAFFFIIMNMVFGNLSAVELFIKNRVIFIHENLSGFYRVSSYFVSTVICDLIPMRFIPTLFFAAITYYMLNFRTAFDHFLVYFLALFFVSAAASSVAFFLSAVFRIFAVANLLIAMVYVLMMVFSGLLVNLDSVPDWLEWLKHISIFKYSMSALSINELKDMTFDGNCTSGNEYLDIQGIDYESDWDLWLNFMAMGVIALGFLILAYLRLVFMNKFR